MVPVTIVQQQDHEDHAGVTKATRGYMPFFDEYVPKFRRLRPGDNFHNGFRSKAQRALNVWFSPRTAQAINSLIRKYQTVMLEPEEHSMHPITRIQKLLENIHDVAPTQESTKESL